MSKARQRLGEVPVKELFHAVAVPLASPGLPGAFLGGRRLMALDGSNLDAQDSEENAAEFGYVTSGENTSAFPKIRLLILSEIGTRAILDAEIAGYAGSSEQQLAARLAGSVQPGMLLLMDSQTWGYPAWDAFRARGCDLLWKVAARNTWPILQSYPDGSWLSLMPSSKARRRMFHRALEQGELPNPLDYYGHPVRVIEYEVINGGKTETITLVPRSWTTS